MLRIDWLLANHMTNIWVYNYQLIQINTLAFNLTFNSEEFVRVIYGNFQFYFYLLINHFK